MQEKAYQAAVCNICGDTDYRRLHFFKEWNFGRDPVRDVSIVQCRKCRVRRRMPEIIDDYEAEYHLPYLDQGQTIHPHQLSHFADLMTARLRQFYAKDVKFLDVGCSTGRALRLAATMGFEAIGLDFSRWAGHEAKIELTLPIEGRKRFRGVLLGLDGQDVMIRADNADIKFPFRAVANAKLVLTDKLINEDLKARKQA